MNKIRVVLADDHIILRSGLRKLLEEQSDIEVIGEADDGNEAIARTIELTPDVLLLDLSMPGLGGMEVIRNIKASMPEVTILVLTMYEDEGHFIQALEAGASGYIPKKAADTDLIAAIRAVTRGEVFIYSSFGKAMVKRIICSESPDKEEEVDIYQRLSQREQEVLKLVAQGFTNKQIAEQLYLSVKTVETYKARIIEKLNLHGRAELVRFALQRGLLTQEVQISTRQQV